MKVPAKYVLPVIIAVVAVTGFLGWNSMVSPKVAVESEVNASAEAPSETTPVAQPDAKNAIGVVVNDGSGQNWLKRCSDIKDQSGNTKQFCEAYQAMYVGEKKERYLEMAFGFPEGSANAAVAMILPTGIFVMNGVTLQVDKDTQGKKVPIHTCFSDACTARFGVDSAFIERMKSGSTLTVGIVDAKGKKINIQLSLKGITEVVAQIQPIAPAVAEDSVAE